MPMKLATLVAAALLLPASLRAESHTSACPYWLSTTTGWVCLTDRAWFIRELPQCPAGQIWRVTQGDSEQLWECAE